MNLTRFFILIKTLCLIGSANAVLTNRYTFVKITYYYLTCACYYVKEYEMLFKKLANVIIS